MVNDEMKREGGVGMDGRTHDKNKRNREDQRRVL